jgi:hypothetical protein
LGAVVFNRKPSGPELPSLLSPVLWVVARVRTFLWGNRPKSPANPPKSRARQPKNPALPLTEAEALACLNEMLQAINDFVIAYRNGTLPPKDPADAEADAAFAAKAEALKAPSAAPPVTPARQTTPQPTAAVIPLPPAESETPVHPQPARRRATAAPPIPKTPAAARRSAPQPDPRRRAQTHPNFFAYSKIAQIRLTRNHAQFVTITQ